MVVQEHIQDKVWHPEDILLVSPLLINGNVTMSEYLTGNFRHIEEVIRNPQLQLTPKLPYFIANRIRLRSYNGDQYTSSYFEKHTNARLFVQGFIEKSIPEQGGDIESFHMPLKTIYIWIREIRDFTEGTTVI